VRRLLLVWWSNTGGTRALVEEAVDAGREACAALADASSDLELCAVRCDRVAPAALLRADAFVFATPECLGSVAGPMKSFFDRCYYPVLDALAGRAYATLVCAGTDGHGAIRQVDRIATGWRLRRVAEPCLVLTGAQTPEQIAAPKHPDAQALARARRFGATLAAGTLAGVW